MRLIDADELKIEITKQIAYFKDKANTTSINQDKIAYCRSASGLELAKSLIDNAPTLEPTFGEVVAYECGQKSVERPKGEWIFIDNDIGWDKCSNCDWTDARCHSWNFCPNCGAKMTKEDR